MADNDVLFAEFHPVGTTMTSHVKLRKERVGIVDYDTQIKGKLSLHLTISTLI